MLRLLIASCLVLLLSAAGPDDVPSDLAKWIETNPPESNDERYAARQDFEHEWVVFLSEDRPRVRLRDRRDEVPSPLPFTIAPGSRQDGLAGRRLSAKVADGWIVSFNGGEFGAGLWWFSPDGKDRYKIAEAWIQGFIPTDAGLLALEGLNHGTTSFGRLIRLVQVPGGRWRTEDVVDLKHRPVAAVKMPSGSLLIATTERVLRVSPTEKKVEILHDGDSYYPNSMIVAPSGAVYIGMRHGVAKLEQQGGSYKSRWLLPNKAFVDMKFKEGFR